MSWKRSPPGSRRSRKSSWPTPEADRYPTLLRRVEVVPCMDADHDDDCDGANITHWHCRICDEEIDPGTIAGPHTEPFFGLSEWTAKVGMPAADAMALAGADLVSIRAECRDMQLFGIAGVISLEVSSTDRGTVELYGAGPLGRTKARRAVPA